VNDTGGLQANPEKNVFSGSVSKINFDLKDYYIKDLNLGYFTEVGMSTRQTLSENFMADIYIRLLKSMSTDSEGVDLQLMKASIQYVGTYFQLCGGRIETTKIFS